MGTTFLSAAQAVLKASKRPLRSSDHQQAQGEFAGDRRNTGAAAQRDQPGDRRGLARAALSAVPIAGGPLAELFDLVIEPGVHRRYHAWLNRLAAMVDEVLGQKPQPPSSTSPTTSASSLRS